jgi:hypothetical protein
MNEHDALITVAREPRLLRELHARLGDQLRLQRVTPESLTFVIQEPPAEARVISMFDQRLECVRRRRNAA